MKDPIKIIHKFKNNNVRIQYQVYIYIGSLVPKEIMTILNSIIDKDLFLTLNTLNKKQYQEIENYYGEFWYQFFFISHHINSQRQLINNVQNKKKLIQDKYGKEWFDKHIVNPPNKKISYSFSSAYYYNLLSSNKIKSITHKVEMDFRTYGDLKKEIINFDKDKRILLGGTINNKDDDSDDAKESDADAETYDDDDVEELITEEQLEENAEEDIDLDEITKLYANSGIENNKTLMETSKLISEAINDKKWEKTINIDKKYDSAQDNLTYDIKLEDIFNKNYITEQYIYKDETIKSMRLKVTTSIPVSDKFGKSMKFLPETQYFWTEYNFNNSEDLIMIGQKWVRRNELLKIDIKPNNNIKIYENLRGNLSYLKDSFGYKIKREDDENNIVRSYENYMTNNEIFMLDVYNDLGLNYNPDAESKRNLYEVYIYIYFPLISYERLEQIIQLLNGQNTKEIQFIENAFISIRNDVKLETVIEETVEKGKMDIGNFSDLFNDNHIIQSIIHVNTFDDKNITGTTSEFKFNLYRIFDNFVVNEKYPFIQYQTTDSQLRYKFYTKSEKVDNIDNLAKWFENTPYGISFKIKIESDKIKSDNKYISINLHETGRIEYKITWKEEDQTTVNDINETYDYVRDLLKKVNSENKKIKFILPPDDRFKYAFINTIQKFTIPEKFKINHNDLSDFSRFFFPYVSLVIEPKKRKSKKQDVVDEVSKYGTYLRYKRISKYDNRTKMHLRILYFLRNYDLNDRELIDEISKQYNITIDVSAKELDFVREKYQKIIKRSAKLQNKLKSMPKSKPPGIGIDIQGRDRDNYKIRITGARNKEQLGEIIDFMKVLIYLYVEIYLYKNKDFEKLKTTLKTLTKIAARRNKVSDIVEYDTSVKTVKSITSLDKARLGFKPEKGQSQWTRSCQNSGKDKRRRPDITPGDQIGKLIAEGYKLNKQTGYYEKKVQMKIKNKQYDTIIKAIKLTGENNIFNYFSCDPSQNQEHMYIGFLARGNNPQDLCMPCCFKKDQLISANKTKKNYYLKCMGENQTKDTNDKNPTQNLGDKLYILQDTNKIQEGRFIYLPKYLDIFFNKVWNNDNKIKNHYLYESKSGYFFKYTVKHEFLFFLVALANVYDKAIEELIVLMITFLEKDKDDKYFNYLNNGNIIESFKSKSKYIEYIKTSNYLEYDTIGELIEIPGVISDKGIIFYILNKKTYIIKKKLEKEEVKEKYYLECLNNENYDQQNENRDIVILIKEGKYYFPIYRVQKNEKINKKIILQKFYSYNSDLKKVIDELRNYHLKSCKNTLINQIVSNKNIVAKKIINLLIPKLEIKKQYIDDRHKCKYIELKNGLFLPITPSGINYNYNFQNIKDIKKPWLKLNETIKLLKEVNNILDLNYTPKFVYYDKKKGENINIISLLLNNNLTIPIINETIEENLVKKMGIAIRFQSLEDNIDEEIINNINNDDERIKKIREHNYMNESYNIYRLELSLYLNNNQEIKEKIINIVRNSKIIIKDKKYELRKILFEIIDSKILSEYKLSETQNGGSKKESMSFIMKNIPDLKNYIISNVRDYCNINTNETKCNNNKHCLWKNNTCKFQLLDTMAIDFVNKVIEEMIQDSIKFKEIIQEGTYYVSDIVDYNKYTDRENQKIINASNFNIKKLMSELFGKDKIPTIGKRQFNRINNELLEQEEFPELIELGKQLIQEIISNKDSIIRAYVNSYYWINNPLYDTESRNLGYFNELQTNLTYLFKANIIDYIQNYLNKGDPIVTKYLEKYFKNDKNFFESALNKFRKLSFNTDGKIELFVLSHLINNPIVVYDNYSNVKYIFLQGEIPVNTENIKTFTNDKNLNKTIFIKFDFDNSNNIPKNIYSLYYI
jgi:hypothetical protein